MRPRGNLKLRKVGSNYLVVEACAGNVRMTDVFSLNETAAALWQHMQEGDFSVEELARWLCAHYEVSPETAKADISRQLKEWADYGLLV